MMVVLDVAGGLLVVLFCRWFFELFMLYVALHDGLALKFFQCLSVDFYRS